MNQITREQAFDLAKYRYKLVDKEGKIWNITDINDARMKLYCKSHYIDHKIPFSRLGDGMFILCRDLSQLTETIEYEGESFVPIDKLISIYCETTGSDISSLDYHCNEANGGNQFTLYGLEDEDTYEVGMPYFIYEKVMDWHFNLCFPQETVKPIINVGK